MITFKQFMSEAVIQRWEKSDAQYKEALDWIISNSREALKNDEMIYRGFSGGKKTMGDLHFIDSSTGKRTSTDSNNLYQTIMDSSDNFKQCPSRSNSFICTTDIETAEAYGKVFLMFPKVGTPIAIADTSDFLISNTISSPTSNVYPAGMSISQLGSTVARCLFSLGFPKADDRTVFKSIDHINDGIPSNLTDEQIWAGLKVKPQYFPPLKKLVSKGKSAFEAFCSLFFTVNSMGITVFKYGQDNESFDGNRELWFSGKTLLISQDTFKEMLPDIVDTVEVSKYILRKYRVKA